MRGVAALEPGVRGELGIKIRQRNPVISPALPRRPRVVRPVVVQAPEARPHTPHHWWSAGSIFWHQQ